MSQLDQPGATPGSSARERRYTTLNPATGEHIRDYPFLPSDQIDAIVGAAHDAFLVWRRWPVTERAKIVGRAAELMGARAEEFAQLITLEMGKLITDSRGEAPWAASILRYYAENGPRFLESETLPVDAGWAVLVNEPLGVILAIEPWNFPLYQVVRVAGPQLIAGNTLLLKHSEICPQTALALEQVFTDAGAPKGVFTNVFLRIADVERVIEHPAVQGVTLTGSGEAGSSVAQVAGRNLKKCVLELGGSDPFIILDLEAGGGLDGTANAAAESRLGNAGQSCAAAKRVIVLEEFYDDFVAALARRFAAIRLGDPNDPNTELGPLSSEPAAARLAAQVADAIDKGATVITGGGRPLSPGAFFEPTILTDVEPTMRAYSEELFGPVCVVYKAADDDSAVRLANASPFGLSGVVFCTDPTRARSVADALDSGMAWINHPTGTEPQTPFGGVKRSGYGRELSHLGILEFVNRKLIRTFPPQNM
ncbi:NAD-dependent succinate-semialdehyde dehydrogenase [Microbacterium sp. SS28]|uniref:NAD-dependent succinate-semialdehyde dehydrogenase n=1 Tax=Microbacterium sp. SS28 TaxID=2919948 RepID=UPI001FAA887B|nr:NAD-dependent succinate-semialdehyde dehydrogenase [Microbacterium sp. SS28]